MFRSGVKPVAFYLLLFTRLFTCLPLHLLTALHGPWPFATVTAYLPWFGPDLPAGLRRCIYAWFTAKAKPTWPAGYREKIQPYLLHGAQGASSSSGISISSQSGNQQFYHLKAALLVCRLEGCFCSDEDFDQLINSIDQKFQTQTKRKREQKESNEESQQSEQSSSSTHSSSEVILIDDSDSERKTGCMMSPNSRRKRLRQCHQLCKPLTAFETKHMLADNVSAALALQQREEYIQLLKHELAADTSFQFQC